MRWWGGFLLLIISFAAESADVYTCLNQMPDTLNASTGTPAVFQFSRPTQETKVKDYENQPKGQGWGYAVKYRNGYCEVMIYIYSRQKNVITPTDIQKEIDEFDGFQSTNTFQKTVADVPFSGLIGTTQLPGSSNKQWQLLALGSIYNQFFKYRASCRHTAEMSDAENIHLADSFLTNVMENSVKRLLICLGIDRLSEKND